MADQYPLSWPEGWPRTPRQSRRTSQFRTTLNGALNNVRGSIQKFASDSGKKVENVLISSNVTLMDQKPAEPGVAVYFKWDEISTCIAVDRYGKVEDNLQAIHHVIEAERTKLRHGGLNLVRAAFRGYAALPPPSDSGKPHWARVMGFKPGEVAPREGVEARYRELARERHPDNGGSTEAMAELNAAMADARAEFDEVEGKR